MGKARREKKRTAVERDVSRRIAVVQSALANLRQAQKRTNRRLDTLAAEAPADAPCCRSCWLTACRPEYDVLADKVERQAAEAQRLTTKLAHFLAMMKR